MILRYLLGNDFFLSYSRRDATAYVAALASRLQERGFTVYFDTFDAQSGKDIPSSVLRNLNNSYALVVIATPAAATSDAMGEEINKFPHRSRQTFVIQVGQEARAARWWHIVDGVAPQTDRQAGPAHAEPDPEIVDLLTNAFRFRRRNQRQLLLGVVFASLLAAAAGTLIYLSGRISAAQKTLAKAQKDLEGVQKQADQAQRERDRQEKLALAGRWAQQAGAARSALSYTPPGDLLRVLQSARIFDAAGMTAQAFAAIADNIGPLPLYSAEFRHPGGVALYAFTPDRTILATCGKQGRILFWDTATGKRIHKPVEAGPGIRSIHLSADGRFIAAFSFEKKAAIWDAAAGLLRRRFDCAHGGALSPSGRLLAVECNSNVEVHDLAGNRVLGTLEYNIIVSALRFTPDERHLSIVLVDESSMMDVVEIGPALRRLETRSTCLGGPQGITLSDDGRFALRSRRGIEEGVKGGNAVRACAIPKLNTVVSLPHTYETAQRISPDGRYMATIENRILRLWETREGQMLASIQLGSAGRALEFSGDSRAVITGDGRLIGVPDGGIAAVWIPSEKPGQFLPTADGNRFLTGDPATGLHRIWQAQTLQKHAGFSFAGQPRVAAVSPDGNYFAIAAVDPTPDGRNLPSVAVWDARTGRRVLLNEDKSFESTEVRTFSFSHRPGEAAVLEVESTFESAGVLRTLSLPGLKGSTTKMSGPFTQLASHPALGWLGLVVGDSDVEVRTLRGARRIGRIANASDEGCFFEDVGRLLVCPGVVAEIPGGVTHKLPGDAVVRAARRLGNTPGAAAALSGNSGLRLLMLPSGESTEISPAPAQAAAFSEDGVYLAAADGPWVRLWHIPSRQLLVETQTEAAAVKLGLHAASCSLLIASPGRAQLIFWCAMPLLKRTCEVLAVNISQPEWRAAFLPEPLAQACPPAP